MPRGNYTNYHKGQNLKPHGYRQNVNWQDRWATMKNPELEIDECRGIVRLPVSGNLVCDCAKNNKRHPTTNGLKRSIRG